MSEEEELLESFRKMSHILEFHIRMILDLYNISNRATVAVCTEIIAGVICTEKNLEGCLEQVITLLEKKLKEHVKE